MHECSHPIGGHGCVGRRGQRRFQPQVVANDVAQEKPKADWSDNNKKKVQYELISSLGVNEYHFVSHCKTDDDKQ